MNRRAFIRWLSGVGITSLVGVSSFQILRDNSKSPVDLTDHSFSFLNDEDQVTLLVLVPIFVYGEKRESSAITQDHLIQTLVNIDAAIMILPERTQDELRQLFILLNNGMGRWLLAGVWQTWSSAQAEDLLAFLQHWRNSLLTLLQTAYQGLHQIIMGSFYAEPESWLAISYPGPPTLSPQ